MNIDDITIEVIESDVGFSRLSLTCNKCGKVENVQSTAMTDEEQKESARVASAKFVHAADCECEGQAIGVEVLPAVDPAQEEYSPIPKPPVTEVFETVEPVSVVSEREVPVAPVDPVPVEAPVDVPVDTPA